MIALNKTHALLAALLTAALLACGLAVFSAPASAATFTDHVCEFGEQSEDFFFDQRNDTSYEFLWQCPDPGIMLHAVGATEPGTYRGFWELRNDAAPVVSAKVTMAGSNGQSAGLHQGFIACGQFCDWDKVVSTAGDDEEPAVFELTKANGLIPENASRIAITGVCVGPDICMPECYPIPFACTPGPPIYFSDIEVVREDNTPPTADIWSGNAMNEHIPGGSVTWVNEANYGYEVGDVESRIKSHSIYVNDSATPHFGCELVFPSVHAEACDDHGQWSNSWMVSPEQLDQGENNLKLVATNRAELTTEATAEVWFDSFAPARPDNLVVTPRVRGRVNNRQAVVSWENGFEVNETERVSGIRGYVYDVEPLDGGADDWNYWDRREQLGANSFSLLFHRNGEFRVTVSTFDGAGNTSEAANVDVVVDDTKPVQPVVEEIPPISGVDLVSGRTINWSWPGGDTDNICGSTIAFDPDGSAPLESDPVFPDLDGDTNSYHLSPTAIQGLAKGLNNFHIRSYSCAGVSSDQSVAPFLVDVADPTASISPSSGWISSATSVKITAADSGPVAEQTGIDRIVYTDNGNETTIDSATAMLALAQGNHTISYKAFDGVGNEFTGPVASIGVDNSLPEAEFDVADPAAPLAVKARATDLHSGIKQAWIQFRPLGDAEWSVLGDVREIAAPSAGTVELDATLPDESDMPLGTYELQVVAYDRVGHHTTSGVRNDGSAANFSIPVRPRVKLSAGITATSSRKPPTGELTVDFGKSATVSGQLLSPDGGGIGDASIEVVQEFATGTAATTIATTATPSGRYEFTLAPGVNRTIRVRFAGDARYGPANARATLRTRAKVTMRAIRGNVRSGKSAQLRGRIALNGVAVPAGGKLIAIQAKTGRRWGSLGALRRSFDDGSFVFTFKRRARKRPMTFTLRALVVEESTWPFATATSAPVKVRFVP